jgi:hypothetical protein
MINPQHYESEDNVLILPFISIDSIRDMMKSEFDQIRAVVSNGEDADRIVRIIKSRYKTFWSQYPSLFSSSVSSNPVPVVPMNPVISVTGHSGSWSKADYKNMSLHSDEIVRNALTRRMQTPEYKRIERTTYEDEGNEGDEACQ